MTTDKNSKHGLRETSESNDQSGSGVDDSTEIRSPSSSSPSSSAAEPKASNLGSESPSEDVTITNPQSAAIDSDEAELDSKFPQIGTVIKNRFELTELLGHGGMGVVYRALDKRKQEAQDRDPYIAIKILGEDFQRHPQGFIALQREARKSQDLAHPNIITVYDFDRDGDTVYMTMEQLDGSPLDHIIQVNPRGIEVKKALKAIKEIAQGLAYAHSKNIVHSDLKPSNIFLTEAGTVKILDFGIARAMASTANIENGDQTVFDAGELGGLTPAYASNEMINGDDPHTSDDVYALGLVGYELLTGFHAYRRKRADVALEEELKPRRIKSLKANQRKALLGAVELQREKRIQNAQQFLNKLEGISGPVKFAAASLVIAVVMVLASVFLMPAKTGPGVDFDDLPVEQQQQITQALEEGSVAMEFSDYNGALFHFNNAYELHPMNPDAVRGLRSVVDKVLKNINLDASQSSMGEQLRQIETLLEFPSLSEDGELLRVKQQLGEKITL